MPYLYRPNRSGFDAVLGCDLKDGRGRLSAQATFFNQVKPVDDNNAGDEYLLISDPSFMFYSLNKGSEFDYNFGGNYSLSRNLKLESRFFSYNYKRAYAKYAHDLHRNYFHAAGILSLSKFLSLSLIFDSATINGIADDGACANIKLNIPGITLKYDTGNNCAVKLEYKDFNHSNQFDQKDVYNANSISTWLEFSF